MIQESMIKKIEQWANERNLLQEENQTKQFIKLTEEVGELANAILKQNKLEQIDAIGDIQVVLIILCAQLGLNYENCLNTAYQVIKNRTGKTVNGTFIKD
jgi:NTP pyrophosphatase (non-canonical NTP hydrolase)